MVLKQKKRKYNNEDDRDVYGVLERLREANVKPTTANLLRCGIGARTLYFFKRRSNLLQFKRKVAQINSY